MIARTRDRLAGAESGRLKFSVSACRRRPPALERPPSCGAGAGKVDSHVPMSRLSVSVKTGSAVRALRPSLRLGIGFTSAPAGAPAPS